MTIFLVVTKSSDLMVMKYILFWKEERPILIDKANALVFWHMMDNTSGFSTFIAAGILLLHGLIVN